MSSDFIQLFGFLNEDDPPDRTKDDEIFVFGDTTFEALKEIVRYAYIHTFTGN